MSHETAIITDEWVAASDEIRRRRLRTVNAALLEALEGVLPFVEVEGPRGAMAHGYAISAIALAKGEKP